MGKLFGTDGIRGMANEFPMTPEIAMGVGKAVSYVLRMRQPPETRKGSFKPHSSRRVRVVVGKDTRLANYMVETAMVSGICAMGGDALLIGPMSTPGVAFVTQSMRADAGVMISASHNPYHDTGIKLFGADGFKLPDEAEHEIERLVFSNEMAAHLPKGEQIGKAFRIEDAIGRYLVFLKSLFPKDLDLQGLRVVVDCANGAAYKVAPLVFEELGAEVIRRGVQPNGLNINQECGALFPENVAAATLEYRADLGISLDGDGDRCILSDEKGEIVDGDQIIGLCAMQMSEANLLAKNTVVTTPMSNMGLELTLREHRIEMVRAPVGDRHVVMTMRQKGYSLGGEQSGHIVFLDLSTTGDGIVAALKVLEAMRRSGKPLSELKRKIRLFPQAQENVKITKKRPLENEKEIQAVIGRAKETLKDRGRVFVRYSGTEPLARVMVEGEDSAQIQTMARQIASTIQRVLG